MTDAHPLEPPLSKVVRSACLTLLAFVVAGDLVGVVACFLLDVIPSRHTSSLLYYVIWFVLGVFAGLAAYMQAGAALAGDDGSWVERAGAKRLSQRILAVFVVLLAALTALSWALFWTDGGDGVFVPDDAIATVIYLGTMAAAAGFGHHLFHAPTKPKG